MHTDLEQMFSPRVIIRNGECLEILTPAIRNPSVLRSAKSFVTDHLYSAIEDGTSNDWAVPKKALCFGKVLSPVAIFIWFGVVLCMSITVTCIVGVARKDLGIGMAAGGLVFAVCASAQCLLLYRQRLAPG